MDDARIAKLAKALAHPARVRIVRLLASHPECAGKEVFAELPLAQSTVSQHLAVLKDAGVVTDHAVGASRVYCLDASALSELARAIGDVADRSAACVQSSDRPKG
ncbi:metalloregulator ArsR/SmtB family transcription factor [Coriobacteriia bacterium Es71-Z0120]|uniref:ArsR/SmtB family transcription factor n=1 Tax=Parvivirga hydrogeniphila TaxID=2939460 RepID=UPI002260CF03|nr:metalloregulator ArsR/SmtB family transcription factor [Parvivirga hydrogeniphila]MCL4078126.1 metalloregulator ArsR/SmtB family transcription factor [Parvivirga hydrogeniphila]